MDRLIVRHGEEGYSGTTAVYSHSFPTCIFFFPPSILHLFPNSHISHVVSITTAQRPFSTLQICQNARLLVLTPTPHHRTIISIIPPAIDAGFHLSLVERTKCKSLDTHTHGPDTLVVDRPGEFEIWGGAVVATPRLRRKKGTEFEGGCQLAGGACCDVS